MRFNVLIQLLVKLKSRYQYHRSAYAWKITFPIYPKEVFFLNPKFPLLAKFFSEFYDFRGTISLF